MNPVPRQMTPILFLDKAMQGPGGMEGINNPVVTPGDPILKALNNLHLPGPDKGG